MSNYAHTQRSQLVRPTWNAHHLIAPGTVEEKIWELQQSKA
jgi:hypothetical protein